MEEIKFRAWDKENKTMMITTDLVIDFNGNVCTFDWDGNKGLEKNIILMQYTGLLDKQGKKIYEGDIVKSDWYEDIQRITGAKIIFSAGRFTCLGLKFDLYEMPELEVIGNIYENPELIKP